MYMSRGIVVLATVAISGCATMSGGDLSVDYNQRQIPGSITVSDAKLYRREALINERRRELRYIDQQMANSEKEGFTIGPDILREFELIKAMAISGGLSVDQGMREANNRSNDIASVRHEMNLLQLNMQLDQIRRDAQLFSDQLALQTSPSREGIGQPNDTPQAGALQNPSPAGVDAIVARIDGLQTSLYTRLGTPAKHLEAIGLTANPTDQFRDRAAYRQVLTAARNAASLDELHDLDGASLYRLTFQATTLPPPASYRRTVGIVEMRPDNSDPDDQEIRDIYGKWLDYVYRRLAASSQDDREQSLIHGTLATTELFDTIQLLYEPQGGAKPPAAAAPKKGGSPPQCNRLVSLRSPVSQCESRLLVVPKIAPALTELQDETRTMGDVVEDDLRVLRDYYTPGISGFDLADLQKLFLASNTCALAPTVVREESVRGKSKDLKDVADLVGSSATLIASIPLILEALQTVAVAQSTNEQQRKAIEEVRTELLIAYEKSETVLRELGKRRCGPDQAIVPDFDLLVPHHFKKTIKDASKTGARVYEVGPREQVQQVSTAARAAEAFSLALAMAANAQSAGASANAGLGYSQSGVSRADLIERLPTVVGYSQNGGSWAKGATAALVQPRFGWIFSPRVNSVNPKKGVVELQQGQRIYDLSADLAVSGWRTKMKLEVRTAWAPDWNSKKDFVAALEDQVPTQITVVNLRPSDGELAALTNRLAAVSGGGQRDMTMRVQPLKVYACAPATLIVEGDNLWRSTEVLVGTVRIGGEAVSILPDMRGITVDLPAKVTFGAAQVPVQVLTPFGVARSRQNLTIDGFDPKGCDKPQAPAVEAAVIATVEPEAVNICSSPQFTLRGAHLDKVTRVRLGQAEGTLVAAVTKGTERRVNFKGVDLAQIAGPFEIMQFHVGENTLPSKAIGVVSRNCGGAP